jgi:CheY-like chemotaxis protein
MRKQCADIRNKRVLIVDARSDAQAELRGQMEATGHKVQAVADISLARTLLPFFWPDLIVVDLESMADDGLEMCAHVRTDPDLDDVRLVVVASEGASTAFPDAWDYPRDLVLVEPAGSDRLSSLVDDLLVNA